MSDVHGPRSSRKIEQSALRSEARYRAILESVVDGVITIDTAGIIDSVNPAAERMFGYEIEELIGHNVKILMPEPYLAEHDGYLTNYHKTGIKKIIGIGRQVVGRRKDGSVFPLDLAVSEILSDGQKSFVGILRDITERTSLEDQLRQAQKMEAVGRLAGGVAHDFNTLLGSIFGYSEMVLDQLPEDHPQRRAIEQIHRGAERGAALTRQLLAFSRRQVLRPELLDLNAVLTDMVDMLRRLTTDDIRLILDLEHRLDRVKVDAGQIEQVIMNLIVNAADAMPLGGQIALETANRDIDARHPDRGAVLVAGRYVMLSVTDSGTGMDAETKRRVFEPFFTTKEQGKGTGLGLSTVYGIVRQSGGGVAIDSAPDEGTTVKVYLLRSEETVKAPPKAAAKAPPCLGSETILLVEDDQMFLDLTTEVLESHGYTVLPATTPTEALAISQQYPDTIHLLVTDMVMPVMTGRVLAQQIAAERPQLGVLLMSGYSDEVLEERGAADSDRAFIQKPFSTRDFARTVRQVLDGQVLDEHGLDEHGLDEHGLDEHGLDEHGLDEHGLDEHGLDEHGLDGQGLDG